jgi:uncharacterized protein (TIGR00297 family)
LDIAIPSEMNSLRLLSSSWIVVAIPKTAWYALLTGVFAGLGWAARGVTASGALAGGIVCFALLWARGLGGFGALLTVFLLTWVSTRIGYTRKLRFGTAESRAGRRASQVLANLGAAAACAILFATAWPDRRLLAGMAAALAEAAADTVSSEIGQVVGGRPRLITTWREVHQGTDGAVTLGGTLSGLLAAILVVSVCVFCGVIPASWMAVCAGVGVCGMIADSVLGATLERQQLLGNNGVNFVSTLIAAVVAVLSLSF